MIYTLKNRTLEVKVELSLNLITRRTIEKLSEEADKVVIDMSTTKMVDSEGVILIWNLMKNNKDVSLIKPPPILNDIIEILDLKEHIPLDEMILNHFNN